MHAISQIHFEGEHLTRVLLHEVDRDASFDFDLDGGQDVPVATVVQLLQAGQQVRIAVADGSGAYSRGGFVTRSFDGELMSLPIVATNPTRLESLPRY